VLARVVDAHDEVAGPRVEEQRAGLEDRGALGRVEVGEVHEVAQQPVEVALVAQEALEVLDGREVAGEREVGGDGLRHGLPSVSGQRLGHARSAQPADRAGRLARGPLGMRREASAERGPLVRGQARLGLAELRLDHGRAQPLDRGGPRGVEAVGQRQRPSRLDARQRELGHLLRRDRHVLRGDREVLLLAPVQRGDRAAVEGSEPAAREVVLDLGAHRRPGGAGVLGALAERPQREVALALLPPRRPGLALGEEAVEQRLVDAGPPAAVGHRADGRDDVLDELARRGVVGHRRRDDAVAVQLRLGEAAGRVLDVGQRDRRRLLLAQALEQLAHALEHRLARGPAVVDGGERDLVASDLERRKVAQALAAPLHGADDLGRADAAVLVGVDERERALVVLEALDRAGQRSPQLEVEVAEVGEIVRRLEADLVEAARARELPAMGRGCGHGSGLRWGAGRIESRAAVGTQVAVAVACRLMPFHVGRTESGR
jgi:hypothetical protein